MTKEAVEAAHDRRASLVWASPWGPKRVRVLAMATGHAVVLTLDSYGSRRWARFKDLSQEEQRA